MAIKSTMRTTVKGVLEVTEDGKLFIETEDARYSAWDMYKRFNGEEVDSSMVFKEEE